VKWYEWLCIALIALALFAFIAATHEEIRTCQAKDGIYIAKLNACAKKGGAFL
jgi:drug/metabolite transporter superfamily protein YnfA